MPAPSPKGNVDRKKSRKKTHHKLPIIPPLQADRLSTCLPRRNLAFGAIAIFGAVQEFAITKGLAEGLVELHYEH